MTRNGERVHRPVNVMHDEMVPIIEFSFPRKLEAPTLSFSQSISFSPFHLLIFYLDFLLGDGTNQNFVCF
jgi:hypothetical protein